MEQFAPVRLKMLHHGLLGSFRRLLGLARPAHPELSYSEQGRDGSIRYEDAHTSFDMYWQFGGGDVLAIIDIPAPHEWEKQTRLPLSQRAETLEFVARQVIKDKTSTGRNRYAITEDAIKIFD